MSDAADWLQIDRQYSSVSELAYQALREAILSCSLAPGNRLNIGELSQRMGVSRTPIRDALQRLEVEGLVVTVPRSHTYVAELSLTEMNELYSIRLMLEGPVAEVATPQITEDDLARLRTLVSQAETLLQNNDFAGFTANNYEFHRIIYEATGNSRLLSLEQDLRSRCRRYIVIYTKESRREQQILEEHRAIIEALSSRDVALARQLLEQHVNLAWLWLKRQLDEPSDEDAGDPED